MSEQEIQTSMDFYTYNKATGERHSLLEYRYNNMDDELRTRMMHWLQKLCEKFLQEHSHLTHEQWLATPEGRAEWEETQKWRKERRERG